MVSGITFEKQEWCNKWWHKFYKQNIVSKKKKNFEVVEFFCGKCGKKIDGYTHFSLGEIIIK